MDFSLDAHFSGSKSGWGSRLSSSFMSSPSSTTGSSSWSISPTGGSSGTASSPGGSSLLSTLLSRTLNTGGLQDMSTGCQVSRGRSQSITPDSASSFIQIPSFARRGSLFSGNEVGGGSFISSSLSAGGGTGGDGHQNNDNVEKECKQVFFDCAL